MFTLKTKSAATKDIAWKDIDLPLEDRIALKIF